MHNYWLCLIAYWCPSWCSKIIDRFTSEHWDCTCNAGTGHSVVLGNVPPYPPLSLQEDHPAINLWFKDDFNHAEATWLSGGTHRDMLTNNPVQILEGNHSPHYYLQHHGGTPVNKREVTALCFNACRLWTTLMEEIQAPKTFSKMPSSAWEFFSQTVLANPSNAFLHWCDNRQWKLHEWKKPLNIRLQQKKPKKPDLPNTKTKKDNTLNDPNLLHMTDVTSQ